MEERHRFRPTTKRDTSWHSTYSIVANSVLKSMHKVVHLYRSSLKISSVNSEVKQRRIAPVTIRPEIRSLKTVTFAWGWVLWLGWLVKTTQWRLLLSIIRRQYWCRQNVEQLGFRLVTSATPKSLSLIVWYRYSSTCNGFRTKSIGFFVDAGGDIRSVLVIVHYMIWSFFGRQRGSTKNVCWRSHPSIVSKT